MTAFTKTRKWPHLQIQENDSQMPKNDLSIPENVLIVIYFLVQYLKMTSKIHKCGRLQILENVL